MKMRKLLIGGVSLALLLGACGSPNEDEVSGNELNNEEMLNVNDENSENEDVGNEVETDAEMEALIKEADPIVDEIRKLLAIRDFDTLNEKYGSPSFKKQYDEGEFENKELIPNAVEMAGDLYGIYRFDDFYKPEDSIIWYEVQVLSDYMINVLKGKSDEIEESVLNSGIDDNEIALKTIFGPFSGNKYEAFTFGLKKDDSGDFKVSELKGSIGSHSVLSEKSEEDSYSELIEKGDEFNRKSNNKVILHEFHLKNREEVDMYFEEEEADQDPFDF